MLELRGITKRFGSLTANNQIDLAVAPGTLHAILGENGAGKSTLMKILSGFLPPDEGTITLDGERVPTGSPPAALAAGIGMLHQDPLVCLPFPVIDNYILGRLDGRISRSVAAEELASMCDRFGFDLDPDTPTRLLSVGQRQQLEIVRLLSQGIKVLILDEPTSGISSEQRTKLFDTLRILAEEGLIVLFVSHKLEEVAELCQSVIVIRAGEKVGSRDLPVSDSELVSMMFGEVVVSSKPANVGTGTTLLSVSGLMAGRGREAIDEVDLVVARSEVVGLAGLEGSGQRTFLRTLAGLERVRRGSMIMEDESLAGGAYERHVAAGMHYLPAARLEEGLVSALTIAEHLTLAARLPGRLIDHRAASDRAKFAISQFRIKGAPDTLAGSLSGGNQQRLLLSMMPEDLRLLLLEHPTRGLDIESADEVWKRLLARREGGTAVIFSSADLDELVGYANRVLVFYNGRAITTVSTDGLEPQQLGSMIGGKLDPTVRQLN